jgi:hypothetical protein
MQSPFPTKKFFIVLLFIIITSFGIFKFFGFLNHRNAENKLEEQKLAVLQTAMLPEQNNLSLEGVPQGDQKIATSTINAIAAVVYLNQQTKANGATLEEITGTVAKQIESAKARLDADTYTKNDIVIDSDNSPEALKKYANDLAGLFVKYGQGKSQSHLVIIKTALEKNDPKELKKLDPFIDFQKNVTRDALTMKVPSVAATAHLHVINASMELLILLQGFRGALDDVPAAVAANSRIEKSAVRFGEAFTEMNAVFKQNGVVFVSGDTWNLFSRFEK